MLVYSWLCGRIYGWHKSQPGVDPGIFLKNTNFLLNQKLKDFIIPSGTLYYQNKYYKVLFMIKLCDQNYNDIAIQKSVHPYIYLYNFIFLLHRYCNFICS